MPTYAYACSSCGHRFDVYQAFTDDAMTQCPECGGPLRKEFGNVGVVFKGSGFYRNDARKGAASGTTSSSGSGSSESSTSTSAAPKESSSAPSTSSTGSAASSKAGSKAGSKAAS